MSNLEAEVPDAKKTVLGLYITSKEAYEQWKADPDRVVIIDVRTQEEFLFVGHPPMAWMIPAIAQEYAWDDEKEHYPMTLLPDFVERVSQIASPDDIVMTMCRSGGRSAIAANLLAQASYKTVYNIIDGMEGDASGDSESVASHQGPASGWKHTGCPWTKKLTPKRLKLPVAS
jgi:rhodanese-related sulfurtransferase